jgi:phosphoribosylamine--glycine ligase
LLEETVNVLIVGGGGREHALAWRIRQSPTKPHVYVVGGNAGTAKVAENVSISGSGHNDVLALVREKQIDLVIVGPEAPLVAGLADVLRAEGVPVVGPGAAAAELEGSKVYAKDFFARHNIPTAAFVNATNAADAIAALDRFSLPVVVKADGLASGKGVIIATTREEAVAAIQSLMEEQSLGAAGSRVVIEEFLQGEEVSLIVLTDGKRVLPFPPAQDHKAIFDGDRGPNTGGMGAYCDSRILSPDQHALVMEQVIHPTLEGLRSDGRPFQGFLYAGLMMTSSGPKVLEFNVRLGDPETQALLHAMEGDFLTLLETCARGELDESLVSWRAQPSVCIVLAAAGYPGKPRVGDPIEGLEAAETDGAVVFHAGTKAEGDKVLTAGGRVLGVTASGDTLQEAIDNAYRAADQVRFDGMQRRSDIGKKGLKRW